MLEESGEDEPEDVTDPGSTAEVTASPLTATVTASFSPEDIRERLEGDEYALALVLTSTKLESILGQAIRHHYGWSQDKFKSRRYHKKSLGSLLEECVEHGALKDHEDELNKFRGNGEVVNLRNKLVHQYGYLRGLEEDKDVQREVEDAIEEVIEFIEAVEG